MSHARETTLTFFVMYISPLKPKACATKIDFLEGFYKNLSFKTAMSRWALGVGCHPWFTFWLSFWKNPSMMPLGIFLVYLFSYFQNNFL